MAQFFDVPVLKIHPTDTPSVFETAVFEPNFLYSVVLHVLHARNVEAEELKLTYNLNDIGDVVAEIQRVLDGQAGPVRNTE